MKKFFNALCISGALMSCGVQGMNPERSVLLDGNQILPPVQHGQFEHWSPLQMGDFINTNQGVLNKLPPVDVYTALTSGVPLPKGWTIERVLAHVLSGVLKPEEVKSALSEYCGYEACAFFSLAMIYQQFLNMPPKDDQNLDPNEGDERIIRDHILNTYLRNKAPVQKMCDFFTDLCQRYGGVSALNVRCSIIDLFGKNFGDLTAENQKKISPITSKISSVFFKAVEVLKKRKDFSWDFRFNSTDSECLLDLLELLGFDRDARSIYKLSLLNEERTEIIVGLIEYVANIVDRFRYISDSEINDFRKYSSNFIKSIEQIFKVKSNGSFNKDVNDLIGHASAHDDRKVSELLEKINYRIGDIINALSSPKLYEESELNLMFSNGLDRFGFGKNPKLIDSLNDEQKESLLGLLQAFCDSDSLLPFKGYLKTLVNLPNLSFDLIMDLEAILRKQCRDNQNANAATLSQWFHIIHTAISNPFEFKDVSNVMLIASQIVDNIYWGRRYGSKAAQRIINGPYYGTGTLIQVPGQSKNLNGRVVLTAAHMCLSDNPVFNEIYGSEDEEKKTELLEAYSDGHPFDVRKIAGELTIVDKPTDRVNKDAPNKGRKKMSYANLSFAGIPVQKFYASVVQDLAMAILARPLVEKDGSVSEGAPVLVEALKGGIPVGRSFYVRGYGDWHNDDRIEFGLAKTYPPFNINVVDDNYILSYLEEGKRPLVTSGADSGSAIFYNDGQKEWVIGETPFGLGGPQPYIDNARYQWMQAVVQDAAQNP